MLKRFLVLLATLPLVLGLTPLADSGLPQVVTGDFETGEVISLADSAAVTSPNVTPVGYVPDVNAISTEFASDEPLMVVNTLKGIRTYDISNPTTPIPLGVLPMAFFQNENIKMGERFDDDGELIERFVLVGFDLYGATPTADPTDVGTFDEIVVIDVTDPTDPHITARLETSTWTHTVGCANDECTHAYTSGNDRTFEVIDLSDLSNPEIVATIDGQPQGTNEAFTNQGVGHDWNVDDAGVAWWVGTGGIIAYDVTDPTDPVILNTSDEHGTDPDWNNFISHNSVRPNAENFGVEEEIDEGPMRPADRARERANERAPFASAQATDIGEADRIHVDEGNVLLVTEEDYIDVTCASEGSFQTWYVPELGPDVNPHGAADGGTITPIADWNTEVLDSGIDTPAGAFCSAHYFDYHQDGYVAQGWYQQGLRILDVNDPAEIRQIGYWITGAQETWGAYWVPEYDEDGRQTGDKTDLIYTNDPTRGLEILSVDLPEERGTAATVTAPILDQWLTVDPATEARAEASAFGYVCLLRPDAEDGTLDTSGRFDSTLRDRPGDATTSDDGTLDVVGGLSGSG